MKIAIGKDSADKFFDGQYELNKGHIKFLQSLLDIAKEFPEEVYIDAEEEKYICKKISLLSNSLEVIDLFRAGKCDITNCNKALSLLDKQIEVL